MHKETPPQRTLGPGVFSALIGSGLSDREISSCLSLRMLNDFVENDWLPLKIRQEIGWNAYRQLVIE